MSEPFIAEVKIFAGNFAPRGYSFCNGQLLPIAQNTALFSLIGTTYGGDGRTTTALPNLEGRVPMHPGRGPGLTPRRLGDKVGVQTVTLGETQLPSHNHALRGSGSPATTFVPTTATSFARASAAAYKTGAPNLVDLSAESLSLVGGGQAHTNLQPYLVLNFIIALTGTYPSRS